MNKDSFPDYIEAYKHWQYEDRTPEGFAFHIDSSLLYEEVERLFFNKNGHDLDGEPWEQLVEFINDNDLFSN